MTLEDLAAQFNRFEKELAAQFTRLENKMDEGFNASKIRDEQLLAKTQFGLEARDILRDEMHRRFDEADRKHDEQLDLLKTAVSAIARR